MTTYYARSNVLGGQVVAEINGSGTWMRGYVYQGETLLAVQAGGVNWVHQDPMTKSQRVTDNLGNVISTVDLDPWGGETSRSSNQAFQPHRYTTYERDSNGSDEAMFRRYNRWHSRFDQPDPYDGSYNLADPQSFNRYAYVGNDPVNFIDPTGLDQWDANPGFIPAWMNGWNRTTNPTQTFINFVAELTTEHHNRLVNDRPWLSFDGFPPFTFGQQPGGGRLGTGAAVPQKTAAQKQKDYQDCLKNVKAVFDQAHRAIPNVFHNSLPSAGAVGRILLITALRAGGTAVVVGSISVSAAAPLVVSTVAMAYAGTWAGNVAANTVGNAAQRGTLLGEEFKARIGCRAFLL